MKFDQEHTGEEVELMKLWQENPMPERMDGGANRQGRLRAE